MEEKIAFHCADCGKYVVAMKTRHPRRYCIDCMCKESHSEEAKTKIVEYEYPDRRKKRIENQLDMDIRDAIANHMSYGAWMQQKRGGFA